MKRFEPDLWAGILGTLLCAAVSLSVLVAQLQGGDVTLGPGWVWWLCFGAYVVAWTTCAWLVDLLPRRILQAVFAAQVLLGATVVLLAPRAGFIPIVLVFTAALSVYLVPWQVTAGLIVFNTVVVAGAAVSVTSNLASVLGTAFIYLLLQLGTTLGTMGHLREIRTRRRLAAAHTELRAAGALLAESSRADERLRIARELHDLLGHQLTVLTLELEIASHQSTPPASEHVTRAARVARELLADVRTTVGELRHRAPDLRHTLEHIVAELPEPAVHLRIDDAVQVDEGRTTALIRCVQEVVTNTIRHSEASQMWIEITAGRDGGITFTAWDDGRGAERIVVGNGLRGIVERVTELGGQARFSADRGFKVVAEVPAP
ncbi:histidine kinase [Polymorphospora sp. NPDC050346]|uniref:sensor histidine kinase n=1 Tax=Polymorphospora sp. NPDC050346 TaxID=3155780 RepID=UPI0033D0DA88